MAKQDGFLSNSFRDADQSPVHQKLGMFGCLQALNRTFGLDSAAGCCSYLRIQLVSKSYIIISGLVVVMQGRVAVFSFKPNDGLLRPIPKWATYRHRHKHILHLQGIIEQGIQWSAKILHIKSSKNQKLDQWNGAPSTNGVMAMIFSLLWWRSSGVSPPLLCRPGHHIPMGPAGQRVLETTMFFFVFTSIIHVQYDIHGNTWIIVYILYMDNCTC